MLLYARAPIDIDTYSSKASTNTSTNTFRGLWYAVCMGWGGGGHMLMSHACDYTPPSGSCTPCMLTVQSAQAAPCLAPPLTWQRVPRYIHAYMRIDTQCKGVIGRHSTHANSTIHACAVSCKMCSIYNCPNSCDAQQEVVDQHVAWIYNLDIIHVVSVEAANGALRCLVPVFVARHYGNQGFKLR